MASSPEKLVRGLALFKWVDCPAGASGEELLHTVPLDRTLRIDRVEVYFPVGCEGQVEARIMADGQQQYPWTGAYRGDDLLLVSVSPRWIPPGAKLSVVWKNNDTLNPLAFSVHLSAAEYEKE